MALLGSILPSSGLILKPGGILPHHLLSILDFCSKASLTLSLTNLGYNESNTAFISCIPSSMALGLSGSWNCTPIATTNSTLWSEKNRLSLRNSSVFLASLSVSYTSKAPRLIAFPCGVLL